MTRAKLHPSLERFRVIGIVEGISYLLLLFVAMPLKYLGGIDLAVRYVGWAHGMLFILFVVALAHVAFLHRWSLGRIAWAMLASVIPFGTFVLDAQLRREAVTLSVAD